MIHSRRQTEKTQRGHPIARMASLAIGSGGGIRTPDLWVMSPTSCRCSTPRRTGACRPGSSGRLPLVPRVCAPGGRGRPRRPRLPWGRPHSTLRRCGGSRPGSGWDRVGPAALSATGAPDPPTTGDRRRGASRRVTSSLFAAWERAGGGRHPPPAARPPRDSRSGGLGQLRRQSAWRVCVGGRWHGISWASRRGPGWWRGDRPRPSARLGSGRLPAVHPPPVNPVVSRGPYLITRWGDSSWGGVPA